MAQYRDSPKFTPLKSPQDTERRAVFDDRQFSPTLSPGFRGHRRNLSSEWVFTPNSPSKSSVSASSVKSPFIDSPSAYNPDYLEIDEREQLVTRRDPTSEVIRRMDLEVQHIRDKDTIMKRRIRRFRFWVRALDLGCRL
jgi:hypothetical protein